MLRVWSSSCSASPDPARPPSAGRSRDSYGWRFVDGDDHHAPAAIAKMRAGIALTDADRAPWLASLHAIAAAALDRREHVVIACSALKQRYRDVLRGTLRGVRFVYLKADEATLRRRLERAPPAISPGRRSSPASSPTSKNPPMP